MVLPPAAVLPSLAGRGKRGAGPDWDWDWDWQGSGSYWAMTTERRGFVAGTAPRTLGAVERSAAHAAAAVSASSVGATATATPGYKI
jgi:hypothetical protein